ncbi:MAG: nuclear transport factor 2 family protein [Gammaproteobacteria bacterium]
MIPPETFQAVLKSNSLTVFDASTLIIELADCDTYTLAHQNLVGQLCPMIMEFKVKKHAFLIGAAFAFATCSAGAAPQQGGGVPTQSALFATVSKLDSGLFDSFNHCSSPKELQKHASYLAPNLEFYHDTGGVTWSRSAYLAKTKKNVCGVFRRELIAGSLEIFPIKGYGAIEQGKHQFCYIKSGECFGVAQFLILWHHLSDKWEATRIFSYGHHPMESGSSKNSSKRMR